MVSAVGSDDTVRTARGRLIRRVPFQIFPPRRPHFFCVGSASRFGTRTQMARSPTPGQRGWTCVAAARPDRPTPLALPQRMLGPGGRHSRAYTASRGPFPRVWLARNVLIQDNMLSSTATRHTQGRALVDRSLLGNGAETSREYQIKVAPKRSSIDSDYQVSLPPAVERRRRPVLGLRSSLLMQRRHLLCEV